MDGKLLGWMNHNLSFTALKVASEFAIFQMNICFPIVQQKVIAVLYFGGFSHGCLQFLVMVEMIMKATNYLNIIVHHLHIYVVSVFIIENGDF